MKKIERELIKGFADACAGAGAGCRISWGR